MAKIDLGNQHTIILMNQKSINTVDQNNVREIYHIAKAALEGMNFPEQTRFDQRQQVEEGPDGKPNKTPSYYLTRAHDVIFNDPKSKESVELQDQNLTFKHAAIHSVNASVQIRPGESGGTTLSIRAIHDGAYDTEKVNEIDGNIEYQINEAGKITSRTGGLMASDKTTNAREQEHGRWAMEATLALEHKILKMYGLDEAQMEALGRRPNSVKTADAPPVEATTHTLDDFIKAAPEAEKPKAAAKIAPAF